MPQKTLPNWVALWGLSLEVVRNRVRRDPALTALGTRFGPLKVYTADEAGLIRAAVEKSRKPVAVN